MSLLNNINTKMKNQRKKLGLSMKQVANYVGVSEATVSRWESGNIANMGRDKIYALSKVLKMTPAEIMGIDDEWDKEAEAFQEKLDYDNDWLDKYLRERFTDEDEIAYAHEIIIQLPMLNKEGLIKLLERITELSELKKYCSEIEIE